MARSTQTHYSLSVSESGRDLTQCHFIEQLIVKYHEEKKEHPYLNPCHVTTKVYQGIFSSVLSLIGNLHENVAGQIGLSPIASVRHKPMTVSHSWFHIIFERTQITYCYTAIWRCQVSELFFLFF